MTTASELRTPWTRNIGRLTAASVAGFATMSASPRGSEAPPSAIARVVRGVVSFIRR
jgi:hypothetical protein